MLALAVNYNFDAFSNPSLIFEGLQSVQIDFFRWGMITDLWGYYLLFMPGVFCLWDKMASPWKNIFAASGIAYVLIGATGAAILASVGSGLLGEYLSNTTAHAAVQRDFLLVYGIINNGLWNLLEMGIFGIFMLGAAPVVRRYGKAMYYLTILLGLAGILDMVGHTFQWHMLADIGLNIYLLLAPVWAVWLGIRWLREKP